MITIEKFLEKLWAIITNLAITVCSILVAGKFSAIMLDTSVYVCVAIITILFIIVSVGTLYTPLFLNYREAMQIAKETIQNLQAKVKSLEAGSLNMLADIDAYEAETKQLKAELEKEKQEVSRIEKEVSTEQAAYKLEIAKLEQKLHEANQHLSIVGAENKDRKLALDKLKGMEEFLFLKELGLQPDQVVNGLAKVIAGMQNNKTPEQKGRIQAIVSRVLKGNTINIDPVESE